jgi:hypothetical protein
VVGISGHHACNASRLLCLLFSRRQHLACDGSFLVIDILIAMQVTSHFLSDTGLLLLRCVQLLFFAVTLTLEGTTGQYPHTQHDQLQQAFHVLKRLPL